MIQAAERLRMELQEELTTTPEEAEIRWALESIASRQVLYRQYRDYYDGKQRLAFSDSKLRSKFLRLFQKFADNLCSTVVDAVADRLQIKGWTVEDAGAVTMTGQAPNARRLQEAVARIWNRNRMDVRAGEVHEEAAKTGDAYVIVWPDPNGKATLYPQVAHQMTVEYEEESPGNIKRAAKLWRAGAGKDDPWRLNLYYANRIEKWEAPASGGSVPKPSAWRRLETPGEPWPLVNTYGVVPVFHFATNAPTNGFGRSELKDAIPLQDALNKTLIDMLTSSEYVALPQRYVTGLEPEIDEVTGKAINPFQPGVGNVWATRSKDATFGQFATGDLTYYERAAHMFRAGIARVTKTPLHVLMLQSDQYPSGESLKTAEAPFVKKLRDRQAAYGGVWAAAMVLAARMESLAPETVELSPEWESPAPRADREEVEVLSLKVSGLGLSKRQALREWGYTEQEIERFQKESEAEAPDIGRAMLQAFDAGVGQDGGGEAAI